MGLDASVMCNCYRQGKTTPCPFPDLFTVDADGYPVLNLPYDHNEDQHDAFDEWIVGCCSHPHMNYMTILIPNWSSYQALLDAITQIGRERFPALDAALPRANEGLTSVETAAKALTEIDAFRAAHTEILIPFLVDSETNSALNTNPPASGGKVSWTVPGGLNMGYDENGFFIEDAWEFNREMFRALRFEQVVIESGALDKPDQYSFTDLDSGRTYLSSVPLRLFLEGIEGGLHQHYPRRVHVAKQPVGPDYFNGVLRPLESIFQAAVEMSSPVRWS